MTNKKILVEVPDMDFLKDIGKVFDTESSAIFYSKDFMRITEIDLDDGTVRDIPVTDDGTKLIFTVRKDGVNFDYKVTGKK